MSPRVGASAGAGLRIAALLLALAGCGGKQPTPPSGGGGGSDAPPTGVVKDTRTEIERRRDAACDKLGPKLAQCAVEDSRAELALGKITQKQFQEATKPDVVRGLAEDWRKNCRKGYLSSRQVRVLEVCFREEKDCAPLEGCLANLKPSTK
jgi:hypothetical protein